MNDSSDFFYPCCCHHSYLKSDTVVFNTKLQELTQQVNYICFLERTGKISSDVSYKEIHTVWTKLEQQKKLLDLSNFMKDYEETIQLQG